MIANLMRRDQGPHPCQRVRTQIRALMTRRGCTKYASVVRTNEGLI